MGFKDKKRIGDCPDVVREAFEKEGIKDEISCAKSFEIAKRTGVEPVKVGACADSMGIRLVRCQLGLFGYPPKKKVVSPAENVDPQVAEAVKAGLHDGRLPCAEAWSIAKRLGIARMEVSAACEALGVKIKPCQLGAF